MNCTLPLTAEQANGILYFNNYGTIKVKNMHVCVWVAFLLLPQITNALEFNIQPRIDAGAVYFEFDQSDFNFRANSTDQFPAAVDGFKLRDTMPFVRGGITFFVDRFFLDVDIQYAFDGDDTTQFSTSSVLPGSTFRNLPLPAAAAVDNRIDSEFDRTEFAVSAGYAITEHFVIFAGYKRAETNFNNEMLGELEIVLPNNSMVRGPVSGSYDVDFIYDGPFVGSAYTWDIQTDFIEGGLAANIGVAFLDGKTRLEFGDFLFDDGSGQETLEPSSIANLVAASDLKGDTIGISLGIQWLGFTPVKQLTYTLGVNGYRYDFDGSNTADFTDTLVRFSVGVQYLF